MPVATRVRFHTFADVLHALGDIPPDRVRLDPPPGTATTRDLLRLWKVEGKMCELVDRTLVAKPMGFSESGLAADLIIAIGWFVKEHDLGLVVGEQGMMKLAPGLVRAPDVSFVSWDQLPGRCHPEEPFPGVFPDLAVEVISRGNTRREMARKRREYFAAGTRLVWMVYPKTRTIDVYTSPTDSTTHGGTDTLDGADVLPGFTLPVATLFANLPPVRKKRR
jgi:Uma2 family endonuclease